MGHDILSYTISPRTILTMRGYLTLSVYLCRNRQNLRSCCQYRPSIIKL